MFQSVVRIFATTQNPDYQCPWQSGSPESGTGSGVVIAPGKVLTGAHVVANATFIQVQKVSDPNKMIAEVAAISHDCDLALLTVGDPAFMAGIEPARLGELPSLRDRVAVVGYPVGGEEISFTEGVVSRIEVQRYSHSERQLLAVTVDAAINDGNSGGPVVDEDDEVVGIAFQSLRDAENIGEMVPSSLIRRFLAGVDAGRSLDVPGLGLVMQTLENPMLRARAGLGIPAAGGPAQSGLLVVNVEFGTSSFGRVLPGDALLAIDGHRIANNGTIQYGGHFRTACDAVLGDHYVGDAIAVQVLRGGQVLDLDITLQPYSALVPRSQYDLLPTYFVMAGFVFQPLSLDFLRTWRDWWEKAPPELLHHYYSGVRTEARQELVVLTDVLADEINVGYDELEYLIVEKVNGVAPRHMAHFVGLCETAGGETAGGETASGELVITLSNDCMVVLDPATARRASQRILDRYRVLHDRSSDL